MKYHFLHCPKAADTSHQSDQIGRILTQWVTVYFGQINENFKISPHFWLLYSLIKFMH
jgi:hypothetical protein